MCGFIYSSPKREYPFWRASLSPALLRIIVIGGSPGSPLGDDTVSSGTIYGIAVIGSDSEDFLLCQRKRHIHIGNTGAII